MHSTTIFNLLNNCSAVSFVQKDSCEPKHCSLESDGTVSCIPPCTHTAECYARYERWPYDTQNCTLRIGTWVHTGQEVDLKVFKSLLLSRQSDTLSSQNLEWKLLKTTYRRSPGNDSTGNDTYPSLIFSFLIERHSAGAAVSVLIPSISRFIIRFHGI